MPKLLRITTVPISLKLLLRGQLAFMQQHGFEVLACSADGKEREEVMKQENVEHAIVPMTRTISPFQDLYCLYKLIRIIQGFKPDIIHSHTPKAGLLGMLAGYICRVPNRVHTVAGLPLMEAKGVKRWVLKMAERITYACANKVYPNSRGLFEYIVREFKVPGFELPVASHSLPVTGYQSPVAGKPVPVSEVKFQMIGCGSSNGIDSGFYSRNEEVSKRAMGIRRENNMDESTMVFSFVGRIVKDKGIEELITAFQKLSQLQKAKLFLVGNSEDDLDPISEETRFIMQSNRDIIQVGFQGDVRPYMVASDVFVFPSYREGFPNVVMQACCLEVPCIVSDINGCNEIIQRNESGLIVKPKDANELYEAMRLLAEDPSKRKTFGKLSREYVSQHFDQQYFWKELLKEYKKRLNHHMSPVSGPTSPVTGNR